MHVITMIILLIICYELRGHKLLLFHIIIMAIQTVETMKHLQFITLPKPALLLSISFIIIMGMNFFILLNYMNPLIIFYVEGVWKKESIYVIIFTKIHIFIEAINIWTGD